MLTHKRRHHLRQRFFCDLTSQLQTEQLVSHINQLSRCVLVWASSASLIWRAHFSYLVCSDVAHCELEGRSRFSWFHTRRCFANELSSTQWADSKILGQSDRLFSRSPLAGRRCLLRLT